MPGAGGGSYTDWRHGLSQFPQRLADAYRRAGREIGEGSPLWYATGSLRVNYRKPTPVAGPITVRTQITRVDGKKTFMKSRLTSFEGVMTVDGEVLAVQVPTEWADPTGLLKHLPAARA